MEGLPVAGRDFGPPHNDEGKNKSDSAAKAKAATSEYGRLRRDSITE